MEAIYSFKILVGKSDGNGPLGWPRHRREDNIKMYVKEKGCDSVALGQRRVAGSCEHGNESSGSVHGGEFLERL
jgi:hypothetical protein